MRRALSGQQRLRRTAFRAKLSLCNPCQKGKWIIVPTTILQPSPPQGAPHRRQTAAIHARRVVPRRLTL
eukprot:GSA120T00026440001.1